MSNYDQVKSEHTRSINEIGGLISFERELFTIYSQSKSKSDEMRLILSSATSRLFGVLRDSISFLLPCILEDLSNNSIEIYVNSNRNPMIGFSSLKGEEKIETQTEVFLCSALNTSVGEERYSKKIGVEDSPLVVSLDIKTFVSKDYIIRTNLVMTPWELITNIVRFGDWILCAPYIQENEDLNTKTLYFLFNFLHWENGTEPFFRGTLLDVYCTKEAYKQIGFIHE